MMPYICQRLLINEFNKVCLSCELTNPSSYVIVHGHLYGNFSLKKDYSSSRFYLIFVKLGIYDNWANAL